MSTKKSTLIIVLLASALYCVQRKTSIEATVKHIPKVMV